jgi:hypothetical protein
MSSKSAWAKVMHDLVSKTNRKTKGWEHSLNGRAFAQALFKPQKWGIKKKRKKKTKNCSQPKEAAYPRSYPPLPECSLLQRLPESGSEGQAHPCLIWHNSEV